MKTCSGCRKEVPRKDCHHNRFGEYICRDCQNAGLKFTWRYAPLGWVKQRSRRLGIGLAYVLLALVVLTTFFMVLERFSNGSPPTIQE
jgi:hypothetical protein